MKKSLMKSIRNFLIVAFVFQLILHAEPVLAAAVGEFSIVSGDVTLMRKGRLTKPTVKTPVETKDVITTGKKAMAKIVLTDGSVLTIAQKSKLEIKDFSLQKEKRRAQFSLFLGNLRSQVKKRGGDSLFQVNTPTAVAGVRGSEFISLVEAQQRATQSTFYAVEDSLTVYNPELAAQVVTVDAGKYTVVAAGAAPTAPAVFSPAILQGIMGDFISQAPAAVTTAAAAEAGTTAGTAAVAGATVGTVAAGTAGAAALAAGVAASTGSTTTTAHQTTTVYH